MSLHAFQGQAGYVMAFEPYLQTVCVVNVVSVELEFLTKNYQRPTPPLGLSSVHLIVVVAVTVFVIAVVVSVMISWWNAAEIVC